MGEPLSVAASVAGLIALTQEIYTHVSMYITSVKHAELDLTRFESEVISLFGVLTKLGQVAEELDQQSEEGTRSIRRALDICQTSLDPIALKLQLKPGVYSTSRLSEMKRKLQWPFTEKEVVKLLNDLERCKSTLSLSVLVEGFDKLFKIDKGQQEMSAVLKKQIEEVSLQHSSAQAKLLLAGDDQELFYRFSALPKTAQQTFMSRQKEQLQRFVEEEELKLLHLLSALREDERLDLLSERRTPGTCEWITRHPMYAEWLSGPNRGLWLVAGPGWGKTVLASYVVESLRAMSSEQEKVVGYACNFVDRSSEANIVILKAIVSQLAEHSEPSTLKCRRFIERKTVDGKVQTTAEELQDLILEISFDFNKIYIVLDGLDESYGESSNLEQIIELSILSKRIRIFTTSRYIRDPPKDLQGYLQLTLSVNEIGEDVGRVARSMVSELLTSSNTEISEELCSTVIERADGNIGYLKLLGDSLEKHRNARWVRGQLNSMPKDLDTMYMRALHQIREDCGLEGGILALYCLQSLAAQPSATAPDQLREDVATKGVAGAPKLETAALIRSCSGLIVLTDEGKLRFCHASVPEFICRKVPGMIKEWETEFDTKAA